MKKNVSTNREWLKWLLYAVLIFVLYLAQGMSFFPPVFGAAPNFMLIVPLCIAVQEGPFDGAVLGAICGTLFDTLHSNTAGMIPLLLMILCMLIGLLCDSVLRKTLSATLVLGVFAVLIVKFSEWFIFDYFLGVRSTYSLTAYMLPSWIYTSVLIAPVYYLVAWIKSKFDRMSD